MHPDKLSMWEYAALVAGWNEANTPEGGGEPAAPTMSDDDFETLVAEVG